MRGGTLIQLVLYLLSKVGSIQNRKNIFVSFKSSVISQMQILKDLLVIFPQP